MGFYNKSTKLGKSRADLSGHLEFLKNQHLKFQNFKLSARSHFASSLF
jgi:hypothetical protein